MRILQGDIIQGAANKTDLLVVPANATINKGKLVMGVGFENTVKLLGEANNFDVPLIAGELITKAPMPNIYGLVTKGKLGFLQVKNHYKEECSLLLLNYGLIQLQEYCIKHPDKVIDMPLPCVGSDGLTLEEVEPLLLRHLSSVSVNIWYL